MSTIDLLSRISPKSIPRKIMGSNHVETAITMIREITVLSEVDREIIFEVINAAAEMYEGIIPQESDTDPYMPMDELEAEMDVMQFYGVVRDRLEGVIGVQERSDGSLIRHLYVRPDSQRRGIGTELLETGLERSDSRTVLVGPWKAAEWAIEFSEQNGFDNLGTDIDLLSSYWEVPEHHKRRRSCSSTKLDTDPARLWLAAQTRVRHG